jgi:cysteine synthase
MELLKQTIRPEFLNRIDEILMFQPLTKANIRQIVDIQLTSLKKLLKEKDLNLVVSNEAFDWIAPARSAVLSGEQRGQHQFQGMGPGFIPKNLDLGVIDRVMKAWEEDAFPVARRLAREEGLFLGMSSGAIVWAAMQVAKELGPGHRVACIAPDSAARYLSTDLFDGDGQGETSEDGER